MPTPLTLLHICYCTAFPDIPTLPELLAIPIPTQIFKEVKSLSFLSMPFISLTTICSSIILQITMSHKFTTEFGTFVPLRPPFIPFCLHFPLLCFFSSLLKFNHKWCDSENSIIKTITLASGEKRFWIKRIV